MRELLTAVWTEALAVLSNPRDTGNHNGDTQLQQRRVTLLMPTLAL